MVQNIIPVFPTGIEQKQAKETKVQLNFSSFPLWPSVQNQFERLFRTRSLATSLDQLNPVPIWIRHHCSAAPLRVQSGRDHPGSRNRC